MAFIFVYMNVSITWHNNMKRFPVFHYTKYAFFGLVECPIEENNLAETYVGPFVSATKFSICRSFLLQ